MNNSHSPTILVVDDEADIRTVLSARLESAGFQVTTASSGMEALSRIRAASPDLVLLDVMLPGIDGLGVCGLLKHDLRFKHIPVVMMTARTQPQVQRASEKLGADAYITKPFNHEELIETVRRLLTGDDEPTPAVAAVSADSAS